MNSIIKSLNMNEGAVLTLEKLQERVEFEAFALGGADLDTKGICAIYVDCVLDCNTLCPDFTVSPCGCDNPDGYIHCHPYKG